MKVQTIILSVCAALFIAYVIGATSAMPRMSQNQMDALVAEQTRAELAAAQQLQPANLIAGWLLRIGGAAAVAILLIGVASTVVIYLRRKAQLVYPNAAGQYPLLYINTTGGVTIQDPNRAFGPTTSIRTVNRRGGALPVTAAANTPEQLQITTQAQAVQFARAAHTGRTDHTTSRMREANSPQLQAPSFANDGGTHYINHAPLRMPEVQIMDVDEQQLTHIERLLQERAA